MPITPLTVQMSVPMTNDLAQVQNTANNRNTSDQIQYAQATDKTVQQNQETVIKKEDATFPEYAYDASRKGNNEYSGQKKKKRKNSGEDEESSDDSPEMKKKKHVVEIDIRL